MCQNFMCVLIPLPHTPVRWGTVIFSTQRIGKVRQEAEPGFKCKQSNSSHTLCLCSQGQLERKVEPTRHLFPHPQPHPQAISPILWPSLPLREHKVVASVGPIVSPPLPPPGKPLRGEEGGDNPLPWPPPPSMPRPKGSPVCSPLISLQPFPLPLPQRIYGFNNADFLLQPLRLFSLL